MQSVNIDELRRRNLKCITDSENLPQVSYKPYNTVGGISKQMDGGRWGRVEEL